MLFAYSASNEELLDRRAVFAVQVAFLTDGHGPWFALGVCLLRPVRR